MKAWQATAKGRSGLFDRSFDPETFRNSTDAVFSFGPLVDSISAHYMWLTYLDEIWKARLTNFPSMPSSKEEVHTRDTDCWLSDQCALGSPILDEHLQVGQIPVLASVRHYR